ncbi:MAG: cytochrome-c peroxidase [Magnetospirillum sp.]|nr:cytochrome-c peroxidase [Magnetospirillum sp.]
MKERQRHIRRTSLALAAALALAGSGWAVVATAQVPPVFSLPAPPALTGIRPPTPDLSAYVKADATAQKKLLVLGKALFWDQAAGSNGMACAGCHFSAGADPRFKNQISPGLNDRSKPEYNPDGDAAFGGTGGKYPSGATAGANYTLKKSDFPMFRLADEANRDSAITFESNDVVSSAGAYNGEFKRAANIPINEEQCTILPDPVFHVGGYNTRRVEPRNTPTMINAAYYKRLFWDGRANNVFNGVSPFGDRDTSAFIVRHTGSWSKERAAIQNMALASQAVGPIVSDLEMICKGRSLAEFGRKIIAKRPLATQTVSTSDSVLAAERKTGSAFGLNGTYADLIRAAFKDEWWNGGAVPAGQGLPFEGFNQMEANFALFWGVALQVYQQSLISDDAKYDRVRNGNGNFTVQEQAGLDLFRSSRTGCIFCHGGPLFSNATFPAGPPGKWIDRVPGPLGPTHVIDDGFFNIGTRPTDEDLGVGGTDLNGKPLSLARQWIELQKGNAAAVVDPKVVSQINACTMVVPFGNTAGCLPTVAQATAEEVSVDGAFKTPMLRNVELTGPYFHYGQYGTLKDLLRFYNRGGDRRTINIPGDIRVDTSGRGTIPTNLSGLLVPLNLTQAEQDSIIAFLKTLTDDRVRCEKAPFDHPSLRVPHGHKGTQTALVLKDGFAQDEYVEVPAVGKDGLAALRRSCLTAFDAKLAN